MKGQHANVRTFTHHRSQFVSAAWLGCQSGVEASSFFIHSLRFYTVTCYIKKVAAKQNPHLLNTHQKESVLMMTSVIRRRWSRSENIMYILHFAVMGVQALYLPNKWNYDLGDYVASPLTAVTNNSNEKTYSLTLTVHLLQCSSL